MSDERMMNEFELNRFWNELVRPTGEPVAGGGALDPALAETVRRIQALGAAPPPASSRERVHRAVRAHLQSQPASATGTPGIEGGFFDVTRPAAGPNGRIERPARWWPRLRFPAERRRWLVAQLATAALLIVTLLAIYLLFGGRDDRHIIAPPGSPVPATPEATPFSGSTNFKGDAARRGEANLGPQGEPVELWRFQAKGPCNGTPAAVGDTVYAACGDGVLYAFNAATGTTRWRFIARPFVHAPGGPTVGGDLVYVVDQEGTLYAVDIANGQERWRYSAVPVGGSPVVDDGLLASGTPDGILLGLDAATGEERWRFQVTDQGRAESPAIADGIVYVGSGAGGYVAVDGETGEEIWRADTGEGGTGTAVVADGIAYIGPGADFGAASSLSAYDARTGELLWRRDEPIQTPVFSNGVGYSASNGGGVYAFDPATGAEHWSVQLGGTLRPPAIAASILYVPSDDDRAVYAFDAATGTELWRFPVDGGITDSVAVLDGALYVQTTFGNIYAVGGTADATTSRSRGAASPAASPSAAATAIAVATPVAEGSPIASPVIGPPPVEFLWQAPGGPEPLQAASSATLDPAGNLWVAQSGSSRFQILSPDGAFIEGWGAVGRAEGEFTLRRDPSDVISDLGDVAFDRQGGFYAVDRGNQRVQQFDRERRFVRAWGGFGGGDGQFLEPFAIAVDAAGNVYVTDGGRDDVQKFAADGTYVLTIGGPGSVPGQFIDPGSLAIDGAGNLYVADFGNHRVQKFAGDGTFLLTWGSFGTGAGQFNGPADVAVDAAGRVYVTDALNNRVQVFDQDGRFLAMWGEEGAGDGQFNVPVGVALDGEGHVYIAEIFGNRVQKFRLLPPLAPAATPTP